MDNYMDRFDTPEAFIRAEVLANRGTQNVIDKSKLRQIADQQDPHGDHSQTSKAELFDLLVELMGQEAYHLAPVGVCSRSFQQKFDITHQDVLRMAKLGFIATTRMVRFWLYGKYRYANTYSPYDYFRLNAEDVHKWLRDHSPKKATKEGE